MSSEVNHSRRGFLRGRIQPQVLPLRPPWAAPGADFLSLCTRCGACEPACPTRIIRMLDGYPQVDFSQGSCTFCGLCLTACTPAALRREEENSLPWKYLAVASDALCIAHKGVECRICGEHCDESAIRFSPRLGGPPVPEIRNAACTGCGACVAPCPVAAIQIR